MTKENYAFISFLCGIVAFLSFFSISMNTPESFLIISILSMIGGLVFGILGLKSQRRWLAIIGIALSVITIPLALLAG
jgi:hypothetical protein